VGSVPGAAPAVGTPIVSVGTGPAAVAPSGDMIVPSAAVGSLILNTGKMSTVVVKRSSNGPFSIPGASDCSAENSSFR
jgi:hypothetical protein